ncbi:single-stranded DNA-binding protein, mitochondrial [Andrographis paniculata]|uniref:single-stranded DNA-binding protein, mitochondrial n=1 Tax=Andrographis paniculata TaxID=175694 RepID=UPI0021E7FCBD|nr:single-stranded DNA-binding protein, mitochondrial [Andrographis paniculata]XP_051152950.1 single-stranded DNA-binding protein, mitochondrial [Andrographis paniculata]
MAGSVAVKFSALRRVSPISAVLGLQGRSRLFFSTSSIGSGDENNNNNNNNNKLEAESGFDIDDGDFLPERPELQLQGVDPKKGWNYRGVHKAIICGKVGQAPVQKILRNGKTVTTFSVGTGGMFDQRHVGENDSPRPVQWHRIAVHNPMLGAYSVQQLVKNSSVYVEGDIETRIYNDSISGEVKSIPEICVRRDGRIRLVKSGDSGNSISFDELRDGLL